MSLVKRMEYTVFIPELCAGVTAHITIEILSTWRKQKHMRTLAVSDTGRASSIWIAIVTAAAQVVQRSSHSRRPAYHVDQEVNGVVVPDRPSFNRGCSLLALVADKHCSTPRTHNAHLQWYVRNDNNRADSYLSVYFRA